MVSHLITIAGTEIAFPAVAGQSVLHCMARLGKKGIPKGCLGGGCGICKIRILSGAYHTGRMSRDQVTEDEQARGYSLACKTFADSDLCVEVVGLPQNRLSP